MLFDRIRVRVAILNAEIIDSILVVEGISMLLFCGIFMSHAPVMMFCVHGFLPGSHLQDSSIAVAYTADGCLSVWDCLGRVCLRKESVLELLGLADEGQGGVSVEGKLL